MLMHDFGKPACKTTDSNGVDHFHGHPDVSAQIAEQVLRRLKLDNETRREVVQLIRYHDFRPGLTKASVRRAVTRIGGDLFSSYLEVQEADVLAQSAYRRSEKLGYLEDLRSLYAGILEEKDCLSLKNLAVNGNDLIKAGMTEGKEIGRVLRTMLEDVLEEPAHNEKSFLMGKYVHTGL